MLNVWVQLFNAAAMCVCMVLGSAGLPMDSAENRTIEIVAHSGYVAGYSVSCGQPMWVMYRISGKNFSGGAVRRRGGFRIDPLMIEGASPDCYRRSGFDRGHMAPAADMTYSVSAMRESFYMTNICPQYPAFNRGVWAQLERKVREYAASGGELCVISGPVFSSTPTLTIGDGRIAVPDAYYKVICDFSPPAKMIAFLIPADSGRRPPGDFIVSVRAVELAAGLNFFPLLERIRQEQLEYAVFSDEWSACGIGSR